MKKFLKKIIGLDSKKNQENLPDEIEDEYVEDEYNENNELIQEEKNHDDDWSYEDYDEGQLSIDVYQTPDKLVMVSTIAGVRPEDIDISINNDMLTIRGQRKMPYDIKDEDYLYKECYWGPFSRSIILPVEIKTEQIEAAIENGVLTIKLPKAKNTKAISIKVKEK